MSIPNRRRGLVPPPPPQYDPEWENRLRLAMEHVLVPSDFTNSYPFNSPALSGGRIEVTQISNVTGGPSNVTGDFTKTSPHDEESSTDESHHWVMRQWRSPTHSGLAYYASPSRLPEAVTVGPNVSGFRLNYDNLRSWLDYDTAAAALSLSTKICFQAPVAYTIQTASPTGRVDDEMLAEATSYWYLSLQDLATATLSQAKYQQITNNDTGIIVDSRNVLNVDSPLKAVDDAGNGWTDLKLVATAADKYLYSTGIDTWAEGSITSYGRSLLDDANASACRDTLGASSGIWGLAVGGTAADLSATGGTSQFLRQSSAGAAVTVSAIGHADLGSGGGSGTKYLRDDMSWQTVSAGVTDHGALTGLSDDDHSIYALLAGRATPQVLIGSTASGGTLTLRSSSHATKGKVIFGNAGTTAYQETDERFGVGTATPVRTLEALATTTQFRLSYTWNTVYSDIYVTSGGSTTNIGTGGAWSWQAATGTTDVVALVTNYAGSGIIPAGTWMLPTSGSSNGNFTLTPGGSGAAGKKWLLAYYDNSFGWRSAVEIAHAAGLGTLQLMNLGGYIQSGASVSIAPAGAIVPARALEVRSTSAQIRASYNATFYQELGVASDGAAKWATNSSSVGSTELEATRTITGAVTDGYAAGLLLDPGYSGAFTVTRHNYLDCQDVSLAASAVLTDACLVRFDAAAGTHKAVAAATTKTTPGGVDAWVKININGTLYYVPAYTSTTA